jgi:hypothetical protein
LRLGKYDAQWENLRRAIQEPLLTVRLPIVVPPDPMTDPTGENGTLWDLLSFVLFWWYMQIVRLFGATIFLAA